MSLKGFVKRLSHDCQIDINRDVLTAYCKSSSLFQLFNNRRKLGRTKNLIAFMEFSFWLVKLKSKMAKIYLNFTVVRAVKTVAHRRRYIELGIIIKTTSWSVHLSENTYM